MRVQIFIMLMCIGYSIPKKHIQINKKHTGSINTQEVKMSQNDLALYETDNMIEEQQLRSQLKSEIANWASAKQELVTSVQQWYAYFEIFFTKQQQIGIVLVLIICFAFYLMVKSEDNNLKKKKSNIKRKQFQPPQLPIQILTESILQDRTLMPQVSLISGSMQYEERVNKSADQIKRCTQSLYRCKSQPDITDYKQSIIGDQSASEIASLLKDIN